MAFIDQGKFEVMKMLSGWEAARCGEHPLRAKIEVSASIYHCLTSGLNKE